MRHDAPVRCGCRAAPARSADAPSSLPLPTELANQIEPRHLKRVRAQVALDPSRLRFGKSQTAAQIVCSGWSNGARNVQALVPLWFRDLGRNARRTRISVINADWSSGGNRDPTLSAAIRVVGSVSGRARRRPGESPWNIRICRHRELKDGTLRFVRLGPQPSPVSFDNRPTDREPQPQAARLGRVEGVEQVIERRGR
jgi:hypothetical protein